MDPRSHRSNLEIEEQVLEEIFRNPITSTIPIAHSVRIPKSIAWEFLKEETIDNLEMRYRRRLWLQLDGCPVHFTTVPRSPLVRVALSVAYTWRLVFTPMLSFTALPRRDRDSRSLYSDLARSTQPGPHCARSLQCGVLCNALRERIATTGYSRSRRDGYR
ncbi:hypothetical protein EVAR_16448_1 [Eumeta japonica]|uniref:Uncharacterized protein n=1 Tax=Eumeta variegata TaxID=151549 RepID=A0A4C1UKA2_EUMVA|nr:hypothetical protein EVAR_16448_1 [Eumeta japonica]